MIDTFVVSMITFIGKNCSFYNMKKIKYCGKKSGEERNNTIIAYIGSVYAM
jgi:hypothetical protein